MVSMSFGKKKKKKKNPWSNMQPKVVNFFFFFWYPFDRNLSTNEQDLVYDIAFKNI